MAEELNVSRQSISKWETDQLIPDLDKILMISQDFNVAVASLINDNLNLEAIGKDDNFKKTNNLKRIVRIFMKVTANMAIFYLFF